MLTINLKGGLGNQMFQYATARNLSLKYKTGIILNTEYFLNIPAKDVPRKYQLDLFNIDSQVQIKETLSPIIKISQKILLKVFGEKIQLFTAKLFLNLKLPAYLNGYFQSEGYFMEIRDALLKEFAIKKELSEEAKKIKEVISKSEAVCINIRRSDYLRPDYAKIFGKYDRTYYEKAISYIKNRVANPLFCIFSDDPKWVKNEFKFDNIIFAGNDILKDHEQLYLMSLCKHNIITNSSFAWWGAWLNQNPNKIVIGPKQWLTNKTSEEMKILPKTWIQI